VVARIAQNVTVRVCFVCSGNICRSPTAEVVMAELADAAGLVIELDSAGTGDWHAGDDMDERSRSTLIGAGYRPSAHRAKQFTAADFATRDLVVALDRRHYAELGQLADLAPDPREARAKIVLLRQFDPAARATGDLDVGDPYYGGSDGFTQVLADIERACAGLLTTLAAGSVGENYGIEPI
jgi:protein-tyrosine phosphatase